MQRNQNAPGLGWAERYLFGSERAETEFILQAMRDIQAVQRANKKKAGADRFARAFHAKILLGVKNAQFHVCRGIPDYLQDDFWTPGEAYETDLRFSNASGIVQPDTEKDLRGIAARVKSRRGPQDFLATNGIASHARDAYQFIAFAKAGAGSSWMRIPRLIRYVGIAETIRMLKTVIGQVKRPIESLATESFYSRSAYAFGEHAMRWQFNPNSSTPVRVDRGDNWLTVDLAERLAKGDVVFDFDAQPFLNEKDTPIEDGSVIWKSGFQTLAHLVIPKQDLRSNAAFIAALRQIEAVDFNPWNGFLRPLGSLNRARNLVYRASQELRRED